MIFSEAADAYRRTRKPKDILWNRLVARPLAALFVVPLARTAVTPNQITFLTLVMFVAGALVLALCPGWGALVGAAAILELSYVFDCVDGQLARLKKMSSPVGAHLDFLMDELKAFVLVAAVGARLWLASADARYLLEALLGLVAVASAISMTTFVRRPEYAAATGVAAGHGADAAPAAAPAKPSFSPLRALESLGRFLVHYPSYILFVALANRIDLFLHVYIAVNAAYAGRALLGVAVKLGRRA